LFDRLSITCLIVKQKMTMYNRAFFFFTAVAIASATCLHEECAAINTADAAGASAMLQVKASKVSTEVHSRAFHGAGTAQLAESRTGTCISDVLQAAHVQALRKQASRYVERQQANVSKSDHEDKNEDKKPEDRGIVSGCEGEQPGTKCISEGSEGICSMKWTSGSGIAKGYTPFCDISDATRNVNVSDATNEPINDVFGQCVHPREGGEDPTGQSCSVSMGAGAPSETGTCQPHGSHHYKCDIGQDAPCAGVSMPMACTFKGHEGKCEARFVSGFFCNIWPVAAPSPLHGKTPSEACSWLSQSNPCSVDMGSGMPAKEGTCSQSAMSWCNVGQSAPCASEEPGAKCIFEGIEGTCIPPPQNGGINVCNIWPVEDSSTPSSATGASASLDGAGFKATTSLCCPSEMETFFNRLLESRGFSVCSKPHVQGLMHWFSCVPDMDFHYMLDVMANGNPCKYWAPTATDCPALSPECAGSWCR